MKKSKPRLKVASFEGSSSKLRAKALKRVGVYHTITSAFFNPEVVRLSYMY